MAAVASSITFATAAGCDSIRRAKAVGALSTLVGALSLARAVNDEELSAEILKSAAVEAKARLG